MTYSVKASCIGLFSESVLSDDVPVRACQTPSYPGQSAQEKQQIHVHLNLYFEMPHGSFLHKKQRNMTNHEIKSIIKYTLTAINGINGRDLTPMDQVMKVETRSKNLVKISNMKNC